jgi:hypothetical protein
MYKPDDLILKNFTNCYDGKATGLVEKLNLNGYYKVSRHVEYWPKSGQDRQKIFDTLRSIVVFYPDGTFLDQINAEPDWRFLNEYGHRNTWGYYSINGDTIKAQYINHPAPLAQSWKADESNYLIIDKNTILELPRLWHNLKSTLSREELQRSRRETFVKEEFGLPSTFVPSDSLPNPNKSWLKNESWFWCNEENYDNWKASLKTGK